MAEIYRAIRCWTSLNSKRVKDEDESKRFELRVIESQKRNEKTKPTVFETKYIIIAAGRIEGCSFSLAEASFQKQKWRAGSWADFDCRLIRFDALWRVGIKEDKCECGLTTSCSRDSGTDGSQ
jgi:hypothetical protein